MTDFLLVDHGSIVILNAMSDEARDWVDEHIDPDALTWGPHGTVIEPRYVDPIIDGILADGLEVAA